MMTRNQKGLYNGYLLCSIKSRCGWCGKEYVDIKEVPPDLASHGIQISEEEYRSALDHLLSDGHFSCYLWCYNLPFTVIFFAALLGLCLALIPIIDKYAGFLGHQTGVEYVLGAVLWMCFLTVYLVVVYLTRRKMKWKTHRRLSRVNAVLMKRHLLAGFEQLGAIDCNKYFIHFFYYDLGPCLAYLQELLMNTECSRTTIYMNHSADPTFPAEAECDLQFPSGDTVQMQPTSSLTNSAVQLETEKVLLNHSGEYINLLIRKKLDPPETDRHMNRYPCLCQYVEHKIYKIMTDV